MIDKQPTQRFTNRVENYVRYRPSYPAAVLTLLREHTGLADDWVLADIGSGPGNLTRLFLDTGYTVFAVEPNDAMREAGEVLMADYPSFTSVEGAAEATTLPDRSVDLVTAGQAFHWFDPPATRTEFQRILRKPGWVSLIWNKRPEGEALVLDQWNDMLRLNAPDYEHVMHRDDTTEDGLAILYGESGYRKFTVSNAQELDAESFWGRLISSSYTPLPGEPGHEEVKLRSQEIFDEHAVNGVVRFPYETQVYIGHL